MRNCGFRFREQVAGNDRVVDNMYLRTLNAQATYQSRRYPIRNCNDTGCVLICKARKAGKDTLPRAAGFQNLRPRAVDSGKDRGTRTAESSGRNGSNTRVILESKQCIWTNFAKITRQGQYRRGDARGFQVDDLSLVGQLRQKRACRPGQNDINAYALRDQSARKIEQHPLGATAFERWRKQSDNRTSRLGTGDHATPPFCSALGIGCATVLST